MRSNAAAVAPVPEVARPIAPRGDGTAALLVRNPAFLIAVGLIAVLGAMAVAPQLFTARDPYACDLANSLDRPSASHWFGFDLLGCEYWTRAVYGARTSFVIGVVVVGATSAVGLVLGLAGGYLGGPVDFVVGQMSELTLAIPLVLGGLVALTFVESPGVVQVALVLSALSWPPVLRLARAGVIEQLSRPHVEAARALGASDARILARHVVPGALRPVVVYTCASAGTAISAEALLSFAGAGLQLPAISWGLSLSGVQYRVAQAPHLLLPGAFLSLTVLAFVLLGESLRTALDPTRR